MTNSGGGQSHKSSVAISSGVGGVVNVPVRLIPGFVRRDILMDPQKWMTPFTSFGKTNEHEKCIRYCTGLW